MLKETYPGYAMQPHPLRPFSEAINEGKERSMLVAPYGPRLIDRRLKLSPPDGIYSKNVDMIGSSDTP